MKVGDVVEINGRKCIVTYVNGRHYSYSEMPAEEKEKPKKREKK